MTARGYVMPFCNRSIVTISFISLVLGCGYRVPRETQLPGDVDVDAGVAADAGMDAGSETHEVCIVPPWIIFPTASYIDDDGGYDLRLAAVHADGSDRRYLNLAHDRPSDGLISADNRKILYVNDFVEPDDVIHAQSIYSRDLATGVENELIHGAPGTNIPSLVLSPDSAHIAFSVNTDLHLANSDGSDDRALLTMPQNGEFAVFYLPTQFSPDGTSLYFTSEGSTFESMALDGSNRHALTYGTGEAWMTAPAFSPDDPTLYVMPFVCDGVHTLRALRTTDAISADPCDAGQVIAQLPSGLFSSSIAWGPNGQLAYSLQEPVPVTYPSGWRVLRTVDFATGVVTKVTEGENFGDPSWAPGCAALPLGAPF